MFNNSQDIIRKFIGDDDDFHLEVEDTGSGMEASEVQRIFERFSRLVLLNHFQELLVDYLCYHFRFLFVLE